MKTNKFMICILASTLLQNSVVFAASSKDSYDKEELVNITPGWSYTDKDKSYYKVTNDTNTFSSPQIVKEDEDKNEKEKEIKYEQILESTGVNVVSISPTTGNRNDFWGQTAEGNWMLIEKGNPVVGWKFVNGDWYYMDECGIMKTGWVNVNGYWYYLYSLSLIHI
eukprot:TRINITY_DN17556_c0_g1_i1.p1 TRINITY_DN17556_c0_g1~~TRINITY_DN17556_c0_g1_i1.p1  ORF type:complete len:166 (-),score=20.84 TRINITY_DN17556_c0_g1_i1:154-651(-)